MSLFNNFLINYNGTFLFVDALLMSVIKGINAFL